MTTVDLWYRTYLHMDCCGVYRKVCYHISDGPATYTESKDGFIQWLDKSPVSETITLDEGDIYE